MGKVKAFTLGLLGAAVGTALVLLGLVLYRDHQTLQVLVQIESARQQAMQKSAVPVPGGIK